MENPMTALSVQIINQTNMSVAEHRTSRRGGTWIQRWRVPLGFLCAALFIIFARPRPATLVAGAVVSLIGILLRAWASGHIRKNDALAISGPYAYTRNPLYLGSFILGLGFTIGSGRWWLGVIFAALFLGIYLPVMRVESATLAKLFGESFEAYSVAVPLFLPRLTPYRSSQPRVGFDRKLYLRYREYRAALGLLIAWALLVFKAYYLK
jgi:protein-S-isoprenylcysteine O-methyltransferase Ste14